MDLKDLNNYQLVLLTLLISFVTSIATGITTVYLLQQAPPQVTGVINNVIQKTIQTVSPSTNTTPQTIVIKEDDLIAAALAQGFQEVGALYTPATPQTSSTAQAPTSAPISSTDSAPSSLAASAVLAQAPVTPIAAATPVSSDTLVSLGVLIDTNGTFIIPGQYTAETGDYVIISGSTYDVTKSDYVSASDISVLSITPEKDAKAFADISPDGVGALPKVGQTALIVGANGAFIKTVISKIIPPSDSSTGGSTLNVQDSIGAAFAGAPVFSIDGTIIGLVTFDASGTATIYGADDIENALTPQAAAPQSEI